jgi:hypothetical protein
MRITLFFFITDPFCIIVGKRILVDLGQGNTLQPGDTITKQFLPHQVLYI